MISIKEVTINGIPLLEIVSKEEDSKRLPTVFFYHGWTRTKESALVNGYELAKRGFRAVLPDAFLHGERKTADAARENMDFWDVVLHNITEITPIKDYYIENQLTDPEKIGVAGLSMGGITTNAMLTQFPWIQAAAVLMGTPAPIEFSKWIIKSPWTEGLDIQISDEEVEQAAQPLKKIALNLQPEKIAGRPVYYWHDTNDELVPYSLTNAFIKEIQHEPYAANVEFETTISGGHKVPYEISVTMAEFFKRQML